MCEMSQSEKTTYYRISFTGNVQERQSYGDRKSVGGCQDLEFGGRMDGVGGADS